MGRRRVVNSVSITERGHNLVAGMKSQRRDEKNEICCFLFLLLDGDAPLQPTPPTTTPVYSACDGSFPKHTLLESLDREHPKDLQV